MLAGPASRILNESGFSASVLDAGRLLVAMETVSDEDAFSVTNSPCRAP